MFKPSTRPVAACLLGLAIAGCGLAPTTPLKSLGMSHVGARSGGDYQLFVEPDQGVAPVIQTINSARRSVDLVVYILSSPDVISALESAHSRGVQVRVLLEPKPYNPSNPNVPLPINKKTYSELKGAGISVQYTSPQFTFTHEKAMVVDNQTAIIETANLSKAAFQNNREYGIVDRVAADVAETEAIFQADWSHSAYTPNDPNLVVSPDNSRQRLVDLIASAQRSVVVQDEEMGDPAISQALGARVRAGLSVRVQLARFKDGNTNAQEQQELNSAGVTSVGFLAKPMLHAKLVVVDGQAAYVGSVNLSTNSMDHNRELGVILRDKVIVSQLASTADQDWGQSQLPSSMIDLAPSLPL